MTNLILIWWKRNWTWLMVIRMLFWIELLVFFHGIGVLHFLTFHKIILHLLLKWTLMEKKLWFTVLGITHLDIFINYKEFIIFKIKEEDLNILKVKLVIWKLQKSLKVRLWTWNAVVKILYCHLVFIKLLIL